MTAERPISNDGTRGDDYDRRFALRASSGHDVHGEAGFVESLGVTSVLDAGCGTGRVAIELARRGLTVVGVDIDAAMLATARRKAPELDWYREDLAAVTIPGTADAASGPRLFDAAVMAGNVMIFVQPGREGAVVANVARHLRPGGLLVAGFQLLPERVDLAAYDAMAAAAGLVLAERFATWDRDPWVPGGDYAVSVHRREP